MSKESKWKIVLAYALALTLALPAMGPGAAFAAEGDLHVLGGGGGGGGGKDIDTGSGGAGGAGWSGIEPATGNWGAGKGGSGGTVGGGTGGTGGAAGGNNYAGADGGDGGAANTAGGVPATPAGEGTFFPGAAGENGTTHTTPSDGKGGYGGSATYTLTGDSAVGAVNVLAGKDGTQGGGTGAAGGVGGNAKLALDGKTLTVKGDVAVTSDASGKAEVSGGKLVFDGGSTQTVTLTKGTAALDFTATDTTFKQSTTFSGIGTATSFNLGKVMLDSTATAVTVNTGSQDISAAFTTLATKGQGNTINNGASNLNVGDRAVNVDLTGVGNGQTALTITGQALKVDNTNQITVDLGEQSALVYADAVTVVNALTDAFVTDNTGVYYKDADTTLWYTLSGGSGSALGLRVHGMQTPDFTPLSSITTQTGDILFITNNLTLNDTINLTVTDNTTIVSAENLVVKGASALDLTASQAAATSGAAGSYINNIVLGELDTDGTNKSSGALTFTAPSNLSWGGGMTVYGKGNSITSSPSLEGRVLNFVLPTDVAANDVMLDANGAPIDADTKLNVAFNGKAPTGLAVGDDVVLVDNATNNGFAPQVDQQVMSRGAYESFFDYMYDSSALKARYGGTLINKDKAHNYLMGGAANAILARSGHESILRALNAPVVTSSVSADVEGLAFVQAGGQTMEYDTGSNIDMDSFNIVVGPGLRMRNSAGITTLGLFFEAGWGDYDANNKYKGDGDAEYYGGGLMGRHDFTESNVYLEGSVRAGRAKSEYDADWDRSSFDISGSYYGAHLGLGYLIPVTDEGTFDLYAKGLWTHQEGDKDTNRYDEQLKVKDSESLRTQIGVRYTQSFNEQFQGYIGAAWEHEFDGEIKGNLDGTKVDKVDLGGSSALGEIGVNWSVNEKLSIGLAGHGALGQREGGGGTLNIMYTF